VKHPSAATNGAVVAVASAHKDMSDQDAPRCFLEVVTMGGVSIARSERLRVVERCGKGNHTTLPAGLWDNIAIALAAGGTSVTAFTQGGKIYLATLPPPDLRANAAATAVIKTVGSARGCLAIAFDTTTRGSKKIFLAYGRPNGTLILTRLSATQPEKSSEQVEIKGAVDRSIVVAGDRAYVAWIRNGAAQVADLVAVLERKRVAPMQISAPRVRASFPTLAAASDTGRLWMVWGELPTPTMSPNIHAAVLECTSAAEQP
jgi:hypothetical protein